MRKLILLFLIITKSVFSQTAILDTNSILIGDQINLNIFVEVKLNETYRWPNFSDSVYQKVEIISKSEIKETSKDSTKILSQQIVITSFDSGTYYLPPFVFNENKKTSGLLLNVATFNVSDTTPMFDITSPKEGTKNDFTDEELAEIRNNRWKIAGIIFAILLIIGLIYYLIKRYKKEGTFLKPKVFIPPHITALNKLQNLKKQKLWQKGNLKEYYSEISLIIREYTENRFEFNALELPTSEILSDLKKLKIDIILIEKLEFILRKADNIKYAKGLSLEEDNKEIMKESVSFITKSKIENNETNK
jgi:hypothetical protein